MKTQKIKVSLSVDLVAHIYNTRKPNQDFNTRFLELLEKGLSQSEET